MRRFLYWQLPIVSAVVAVLLFGFGFVRYVAGYRGEPVEIVSAAPAASAAAPKQLAPVILGDSLARGAGDPAGRGIGGHLDQILEQRRVSARRTWNLGVNGARTADLIATLEKPNVRELLRQSNVIIVSIGGNDLWGGNDWRSVDTGEAEAVMERVMERVDEVVSRVRAENPRARIFFVGLYNPFASSPAGAALSAMVNRWNARLLEEIGTDPNVTVVPTSDLFSHRDRLALDRFHPGGEGYEMIARRIADSL